MKKLYSTKVTVLIIFLLFAFTNVCLGSKETEYFKKIYENNKEGINETVLYDNSKVIDEY